jgi:hypothetical protein
MTTVYRQGITAVRNSIAPYGLMDSYPKRFVAVAGLTAAGLWLLKPRRFFDSEGRPYPHTAFTDGQGFSTDIDWLSASFLVGLFGILVI